MRRTLVLAALLLFPAALMAGRNHCGMCISTDDRGESVTDCSQLHVTIDDRPALTAEESVPVGAARSLVVRAPRNGGIWVTGSDGPLSVTACKAAGIAEALDAVRVNFSGGEVSASGPGEGDWVVYFLVRAPRGAGLDLRSHNGPISLRGVNASVTAGATNGPVSVRESSGTFDLQTQNGPISLSGGSGTAKLRAQNGPITVRLSGSDWDGNIDAHTENGPVSLRLPAGFRSGVVIESDGHGPVSCRAAACREARRTWSDENDSRRIEFGSGTPSVRMSTVNGPASVSDN